MVARVCSVSAIGLLVGCASAQPPMGTSSQPPVKYRLENNLQGCIEVDEASFTWLNGLPVVELRYHEAKPSAECGCKSLLSAYTAYSDADNPTFLVGGTLKLLGGGKRTLPLSVDTEWLANRAVRVSLGCEPPE